jgi:hypothetical protein
MNYQICPKCNLQNAPGMSFCSSCRANLSNVSNFSPEPAPTVFSGAASFTPNPAQNFSAPPKKSNVGKILLAVAGGAFLLLIGVGVVGAAVFYFATKREVYPQNVSQRPLYDNNSNVAPTTNKTRTIDDFVRSQVGDYKITDTLSGNPSADGFSGAIEEKQYKYANIGGKFAIHYTIARYASPTEAQQALRDSIDKYKKLGIKTSEIGTASDNDGTVVGILADMTAKNGLMSRFWTKNEFYIRILGGQKDVDSFFAAH